MSNKVIDPRDGSKVSPLEGLDGSRSLVVLLPQLGEFDSSEFCEQLVAVDDALTEAKISLRVIGNVNIFNPVFLHTYNRKTYKMIITELSIIF